MPKSKRQQLLKAARNQAINILKICEEAQEGNLSVEEFETRLSKTPKNLPGYHANAYI
jgi:hypothetical protein